MSLFFLVSTLASADNAVIYPPQYNVANQNNAAIDQNTAPINFSYPTGNVNLQLESSSLLGSYFSGKVTQMLGDKNAIALDLESGTGQNRLNGTWGIALNPTNLVKFTAETLTQKLPFDFDSGEVDKNVTQNAFGLDYSYFLSNNFIKSLDFGAYYAKAENINLLPIIFSANGSEYINYRRVAGAISDGGSVGVSINPWRTGLLQLALNFDNVYYPHQFILLNAENSAELGGTITYEQLLTNRLKLDLSASERAIYDEYDIVASWIIPLVQFKNRLQASISVDHIVSHNNTPNNTIYSLGLNYSWGGNSGGALYGLTQVVTPSLTTWVDTPAVYMQQVLAAVDQLTEKINLALFGISPNGITFQLAAHNVGADGDNFTLSGNGFSPGAIVLFGNTAAKIINLNLHTIVGVIPNHVPGTVNVSVSNPSGASAVLVNAFTYGDPTPAPSSISPSSGNVAGGTNVTISGRNFTGATSVKFGGTTATNLVVVNDTTITCTSPAHAAGAVDVDVTATGGTGTLTNGFTYTAIVAAPTVTNVNPNSGSTAGGNSVTITGTNFINVSAVKFGGVDATSFTVNNDTQITATVPAHSSGAVAVAVTNTAGTGSLASAYTYNAPNITGISPTSGTTAGGTSVIITGTNFIGITAVKFDTTDATSFTVNSATQITATTPTHSAATVNVVVSNAGDTGTLTNGYRYIDAPTVTNVNPNSGSTAGGNSVTITGTDFVNVSAVKFGGTDATSFTVDSETQITATVPAHTGGAVTVAVTTNGGTGNLNNGYTYNAPTVTNASPNSGSTAGGTSVILTGTNFTNITAVKFGGTDAASFTVNSATQITATTAAHAAATVDVTVSNTGDTGTLTNGYRYIDAPTVTNVNPNSGSTAGGNSVTITGTDFVNVSAVKFGGTDATSFTVDSETQITATVPAHSGGAVTVAVTTNTGTGNLNNGYTYNAPTVTNASPNSGSTAGGASVTITGTNFSGITAVKFGGTDATSFTVNSATQITATTAAHSAGTVDVTVSNAGDTGTLTNGYRYIDAPTVTNVNPNSGSTAGGNSVTITGTDFVNVSAVKFGGTDATSFTVNSETQITATVPAHSGGAVTVAVTTNTGTGNLNNGYTYNAPTVTNASPNSGTTAGGTSVTITGTNFTNITAVKFGGTDAASFTVNSATSITATTPAHSAGAVNVVVSNAGDSGTLSNGFTYVAPPSITTVAPGSGSILGGTSVTITGTDFTGATAVTFGGTAATSFTVNSSTQITATTPAHAVGSVDVQVTTPYGTGTKSNGFLYALTTPVPVLVAPPTGSTAGGTNVTITGTGFAGTTSVTFGGNAATNVAVVSDTSITCRTPAHLVGAVTVVVTNPAGSGSLPLGFTYIPG